VVLSLRGSAEQPFIERRIIRGGAHRREVDEHPGVVPHAFGGFTRVLKGPLREKLNKRA